MKPKEDVPKGKRCICGTPFCSQNSIKYGPYPASCMPSKSFGPTLWLEQHGHKAWMEDLRNVAELSTNSVPMKTDKIQQEAPKEDFHFNAKNTSSLSGFAFNSVGTAMLKIFPYPVFTRLPMNKLQPTANQVGWFKTLLVQRVSP